MLARLSFAPLAKKDPLKRFLSDGPAPPVQALAQVTHPARLAALADRRRLVEATLRAWLLLIGYGFFGWSWTRSGRTPGMLAWKLQLRRTDGSAVRWPVALLRYAAALLSWGGLVIGAIGLAMMRHVPLSLALMCCGVLSVGWSLLDPRRRALHDLVAGTEMVLLPRLRSSAIGMG